MRVSRFGLFQPFQKVELTPCKHQGCVDHEERFNSIRILHTIHSLCPNPGFQSLVHEPGTLSRVSTLALNHFSGAQTILSV